MIPFKYRVSCYACSSQHSRWSLDACSSDFVHFKYRVVISCASEKLSYLDGNGTLALGDRDNIFDSFISELEVLLEVDMVLDAEVDDWSSKYQCAEEQTPGRSEFVHVRSAEIVDAPDNCGASRLDTFVEASEIGNLAAVVGETSDVPVDASLPSCIVEAIEDVEEHDADVTIRGPIHGFKSVSLDRCASVTLLESISTTPDSKSEEDKSNPQNSGAHSTTDKGTVKSVTKDKGTNDLKAPVENVVQSLGASVEVSSINTVELVGVEPVGAEEHWEESDNPRVGAKCVEKTKQLGLPGWVLHEDDARVVSANNSLGVDEAPSKTGSEKGENDETNIRSVGDGAVGLDVDVLTEWNLE